jgi:hypothetical protein
VNDLTTQNVLKYVVTIVAGSLAAALGVLAVQLAGTDPIMWRPVAAAAIGPIVTGLAAMQLTRLGSEGIAAQVDTLKAGGTARSEMVVLSQDEAVPRLAGALSPDQVRQIVAALKAEMARDPEGDDPLPSDPVGHISALLDQDERGRSDP